MSNARTVVLATVGFLGATAAFVALLFALDSRPTRAYHAYLQLPSFAAVQTTEVMVNGATRFPYPGIAQAPEVARGAGSEAQDTYYALGEISPKDRVVVVAEGRRKEVSIPGEEGRALIIALTREGEVSTRFLDEVVRDPGAKPAD